MAAMARRSQPTLTPPTPERIIDVDVSDEMRGSFLEYAYSVIYARALPDARDGLKPVQRRILFGMAQMGLRPDRDRVKSARVVGDVMGSLHPHGDSAIYDALARMAQPFSLRLALIDGQGNFGSPDSGPAAMRYTECRLAAPAMAFTDGLDEDVVDFKANYDGRETEPEVLPAAIPGLLVNGASGIAVGMATNLAPHNLGETIAAARHLLNHPNATLDDLMKFVPGPDLPTGGRIVGLDGVREAYETGRGSFRIRATTDITSITPRRKGIVITELPYNVGPEQLKERVRDLVISKKLQGIADINEYSDLDRGTEIVIEIKSGFVPEAVLDELFRQTPLEVTFSINAVALVEGQPRTLGLREMLQVFVDHRLEVTRRRCEYRRRKANERLHLVDGLLVAILDIDEVIAVIRGSDDTAEARTRLMSVFDLSEIQTNYILEMPLRRLTKFSKLELETERDELATRIAELTAVLEDPKRLRRMISDELTAVSTAHATPRRTVLLEAAPTLAPSSTGGLEIDDSPCAVLLSSTHMVARTTVDHVPTGEGSRAQHDSLRASVRATARGEVGVVTSAGRLHRVSVLDLPTLPPTAAAPSLAGGVPLAELLTLPDGDRAITITSLVDPGAGLVMATRSGSVKRLAAGDFPATQDSWSILRLDDGDELVAATEAPVDTWEVVFVTSDSSLLHFPLALVRPTGRGAGGVAGINVAKDAHVIGVFVVDPEALNVVVTVARSGRSASSVKVSAYNDFPAKGRGTAGLRSQRFLSGETDLLTAYVGPEPARAANANGKPVALPEEVDKRDASGRPVAGPITAICGPARLPLITSAAPTDSPAAQEESAVSQESPIQEMLDL